jgi:alpha-beta hydrolase superfamily lysophospholipase
MLLSSMSLTACQFAMPGQAPNASEEDVVDEETLDEEATEEGSEEEEESQVKAAPPETHQRYTQLEDYHPKTLSWETLTGLELKGNLYSPHLETEALKQASLSVDDEEIDEEEEEVVEEEEAMDDTEDDEEDETPPPTKKVELPKYRYPLIVLLHNLSGSQKRAASFVPQFVQAGYAVLVLDLPGHGESTSYGPHGPVQSWRAFESKDWMAMVDHLKQVEQFFENPNLQDPNAVPEVIPKKMGIIAEGIGANIALTRSGEKDADIAFIVSIGATIESKGISPTLALLESKSPTLFMASKSEPTSYTDTQKLYRLAEPAKALRLYNNIGLGFEIYDADPEVRSTLSKWVALHLPPRPLVPEWNNALRNAKQRWDVAQRQKAAAKTVVAKSIPNTNSKPKPEAKPH